MLEAAAWRDGRPTVAGGLHRPRSRDPSSGGAALSSGLGVLPAIVALLRLQPGPLRVAVGVGLRAGDAARRSSRRSARQGLFSLAHVPMNLDYFLLHLPKADRPASRSSGPTASGCPCCSPVPGLLFAVRADWRQPRGLVAARGGDRRPHPDAPLLRRRLAPVRLPLLPRLGAVRHRPVRAGGGEAGADRLRLAGADRVRDGGHGLRRLLGGQDLMAAASSAGRERVTCGPCGSA